MNDLYGEEQGGTASGAASRLIGKLPQSELDQLTRLASRLLRAPNALITLITSDRQYVENSANGAAGTYGTGTSQPLDLSFCKHAVAAREPFVVEDARTHPLVKDSAAIAAGVIAYAGVPLQIDGEAIGALCVIDSQPRRWSADEIDVLTALARAAMLTAQERDSQLSSSFGLQQTALLSRTANHLRAVSAYEEHLTTGSTDLKVEARLREAVVETRLNLEAEVAQPDSMHDNQLHTLAARYVAAERARDAATKKFANGEIKLSELEGSILMQADMLAELRVASLDRGVLL